MASLTPASFRIGAALMLALLSSGAHAQVDLDSRLPIVIDADNSELDLAKDTTVFYGLRITQGATRIEAQRAETSAGTNFADSSWRFVGNVEIDVNGASIRADVADLRFVRQRLVSARVSGAPATFIDRRADVAGVTEGAANEVEYNLENGMVRFEGDARIADASNEVTGSLLIYDVQGQQIAFEGDSQTGERVKIVVQPQEEPIDNPLEGEQDNP